MLIISDGDFLKVYKLHCKWEDHALAARFLPIRAFFFLFGRFFSWKKISLLEATLASRFESSFNNFFFVCFARKAGEERNNWYKNLMRMSKKTEFWCLDFYVYSHRFVHFFLHLTLSLFRLLKASSKNCCW